MAAHVLSVINEAKKQVVVSANELALLSYYKHGADNAQWGKALDLRDLIVLDSCETWEELTSVLTAMEEKYETLWQMAGQPSSWEEWSKRLDVHKPNSVGHEYWDVYNMEVDYESIAQ